MEMTNITNTTESDEDFVNCGVVDTFTAPIDLVLEDALVKSNDKISANIADAMEMLYNVFGKDPFAMEDTKEHMLAVGSKAVDVRLAQLGIDRRFELEQQNGKVAYIPNKFDICCDTSNSSDDSTVDGNSGSHVVGESNGVTMDSGDETSETTSEN